MFFYFFAVVNLHAQSLEAKMDSLVSDYARKTNFNGAVLVAQKGKVIFQKGYGYKDADGKIPNDVNSIFQIGSITKQFTAALIMQLAQEKKLSVKDKLSKYFPGYPNANKITIEHLLTHTSGIYNYTNDTNLIKGNVTRHYNEKEMLATFRDRPLDFEPGKGWNYSNSAYVLLGYIIKKVAKKPYEQVMHERILGPLRMAQSGFDFTHLTDQNKTKGYFSLTPNQILPAPVVDSTISYSAGALYSTVGDLAKWDMAIYTSKVLTPSSWKATFTPFKNKYGYGWGIDTLYGKIITAHSGGIHGFSSYIMRIPQDELLVVALSNSSSNVGKLSKGLAAVFYGKAYDQLKVNDEIKLDSSQLKKYIGKYALSPDFSITISSKGSQLIAQATGQGAAEIFPLKENFFFYKIVDAQIEFEQDANGNIKSLTLHQNAMKMRGDKVE